MASQVFDDAVILAALTVVMQDEEGVDNNKAIRHLKHTLLDAGYLTIKPVPRKGEE